MKNTSDIEVFKKKYREGPRLLHYLRWFWMDVKFKSHRFFRLLRLDDDEDYYDI